jgi:hypothetical protein
MMFLLPNFSKVQLEELKMIGSKVLVADFFCICMNGKQ